MLLPEKDEEISSLNRQATEHFGNKEFGQAIECLEKAQELMRKSLISFPIETYLRLPLYLQQAGRFDEAMQKFEKLLHEVDERNEVAYSHRPKFIQEGLAYSDYRTIYDKMRLACKRQKLPDEAAKYETLSNKFDDKHQKFMVKARKYDEKRNSEFRKKYNLKN